MATRRTPGARGLRNAGCARARPRAGTDGRPRGDARNDGAEAAQAIKQRAYKDVVPPTDAEKEAWHLQRRGGRCRLRGPDERTVGESVYLVCCLQADNGVPESMVAGFRKVLEGGIADLSNAGQAVKGRMERHGPEGVILVGYSRGAMAIGNAMEVAIDEPNPGGPLASSDLRAAGPAYCAGYCECAGPDEQRSAIGCFAAKPWG